MAEILNERDLTCGATMWTHDGGPLQHDEQHAFRYDVCERGKLIGFITADRARQHPSGAMWKRSRIRDGETEELAGEYQTVQEVLATF